MCNNGNGDNLDIHKTMDELDNNENGEHLYYVMDDRFPLYEDYEFTLDDKITMIEFMKRDGIYKYDKNSELYKLGKKLGLI